MGDRRPSQMLRDMRNVLPAGIGDAALKEFWLQKLPPAILTVISGLDGSLDSLAERADRVMDASASREISAVSDHCCRSMESAFAVLTAQIAALVTSQSAQNRQPRPENRSRTRSRTRSQCRQRNKNLRYYHDRFGKNAKTAATLRLKKLLEAVEAILPPAARVPRRLFVNDIRTGNKYLVDSGAELSVMPSTMPHLALRTSYLPPRTAHESPRTDQKPSISTLVSLVSLLGYSRWQM